MLYATQLSTPAQLSHQPDVYPPASRPADDNNEKNSLEAIQAGHTQITTENLLTKYNIILNPMKSY